VIGMRLSKRMARLATVDEVPVEVAEDHAVVVAVVAVVVAAEVVEETAQGQETEGITEIVDPGTEDKDGMIGIVILQGDGAVEMITDRTGDDHVRGRLTVSVFFLPSEGMGRAKGVISVLLFFSPNSSTPFYCFSLFTSIQGRGGRSRSRSPRSSRRGDGDDDYRRRRGSDNDSDDDKKSSSKKTGDSSSKDNKDASVEPETPLEELSPEDEEARMMALMGFGGFDSTKV